MKRSLKSEFALLFIILIGIILSVWVLFFVVMTRYIYQNTEKQMATTAGQIVDDLGKQFANLERVCYALSTQSETISFASSKDIKERLFRAEDVERLLIGGNYTTDLATHVIGIDNNGGYYRFGGKLSNTSASRLIILSKTMSLPTNIAIELENTRYIGYATGIYDEQGNQTGILMMFAEEAELLDKLYMYSPDNSLFIGIVADDKIITANGQNHPDLTSNARDGVVRKHIGITPFEIIVAADKSQLNASTYYFSIAALITVLSFGVVLVVFARIQNKRLFAPMIEIMKSAETLDVSQGHTLPLSGSKEFDRLIEKINTMLIRIDKQNKEIITSGLKLKNAEIERQKAVIFSLKKQINAHFTINTLNTIKILLDSGEYKLADSVLSGLSALIRYAYDKDELISVWDEMRTIEKYMEIMNVRYNNKIKLIFELDDRLMDVHMPRMMLQPLVENSILHGFSTKVSDCIIEIEALLQNGQIAIVIKDNGAGMDPATLENIINKTNFSEILPNGIEKVALVNIKNRLTSQFGNDYKFIISSEQGVGTNVTILIPIMQGNTYV